ncbi:hypothetical protein CDL15_Pgr019379 [Punica granatum]|uniref:Uncharacterized protein n=1 Tax=Punica granatum TaxID=22663 RepID=A0A218XT17_PUNGR|nr:hypothetical protein CDL15_Pgr019379 [Punica granatum]
MDVVGGNSEAREYHILLTALHFVPDSSTGFPPSPVLELCRGRMAVVGGDSEARGGVDLSVFGLRELQS